jgi:hypothetical protein
VIQILSTVSGQKRALLASWWLLETASITAVKNSFKEQLCWNSKKDPRSEPHDALWYNMIE